MSGESAAKCSIRLIGSWQCRMLGESLPRVRGRRAHSLFAHLLINHDKTLDRESLSEIFWPKSSQKQARTNLRRELHSLRQWHSVVDACLTVENSALHWKMPTYYELDTETLLGACDTVITSGWSSFNVKHLVAQNPTPLLPGVREDWSLNYAEFLRRRYEQALLHLLSIDSAPVSETMYLQVAQRLIDLEPLNESAYYYFIVGCLKQGDISRALRAWHDCAANLRKELDVTPGDLLQSLYPKLIKNTDTTGGQKTATTVFQSNLVGREKEWRTLSSIWNSSSVANQFVLIEGEPGIGKTAIANSFLKYIRHTGGTVTTARAFETGALLAFSPVVSWFQSRLLMDQIGKLDDSMRSALHALLPDSAHSSGGVENPMPDRFRRERLFEAMCSVLQGIDGNKVLFLDDIQWCDSDSLSWLNYLFERKQNFGIVLVATRRDNENLPAGPLMALVESSARRGTLHKLKLVPLGHQEAKALGESLFVDSTDTLKKAKLLSVLASAGGNPFYIIEIARVLSESTIRNTVATDVLKEDLASLYDVVLTRLSTLASEPTDALNIVAILGRAFSDREFALLSGHDPAVAAKILANLVNAQFIKAANASQYEFVHDCIREAILAGLGLPIRRHIHSLIAAGLESVRGAASEIAYHLDTGGEHGSAIAWYLEAAKQDYDRISAGAAIQHLDRAIELVRESSCVEKTTNRLAALLVHKMRCLQTIHGFVSPEIEESCNQLEAALHQVDDLHTKLTSLICLRVFYGNKDLHKALEIDCECMNVADSLRDPNLSLSARRSMGYTRYLFGHLPESVEVLDEALSISQRSFSAERFQSQEPPGNLPTALAMLSLVYWVHGQPKRSIAVRKQLAKYRYELLKPRRQLYVRQFCAHIAFFEGDRESLNLENEWFNHMARIHPQRLIEDFALWTSGMLLFQAENYEVAADRLRLAAVRFDEHATMYQPKRWCQYAEAEFAAGNVSAARDALSRGFRCAAGTSQTFWNAELLRLEALIIHRENANRELVDGAFKRAIRFAQSQQALWLELRARLAWHNCMVEDGRHDQAATLLNELLEIYGHLDQYREIRLAWLQSGRIQDETTALRSEMLE